MRRLALSLFFVCSLAACGGGGSSNTPPTGLTAQLPVPTNTPTASPTPTTTAKPSPTPTTTAKSSPSPSPSPNPSPTSTPLNPNYSYFSLYAAGLQVTYLQTTITVPPTPPPYGFISLWPGLDNVEEISAGNNFLQQPLLQWGGICTDYSIPHFASWVAEAFYYSAAQFQAGQTGCNGGNVINVNPGDTLTETIAFSGGTWTQTVNDNQTGQSSTYSYSAQSIDNELPDRVTFSIEIWNSGGGFNNNIPPVTFTNTTVTASTAFPSCTLISLVSPTSNTTTGRNTATAPVVSNGGKTCTYAQITVYPVTQFIQPSAIDRALLTHGPAARR